MFTTLGLQWRAPVRFCVCVIVLSLHQHRCNLLSCRMSNVLPHLIGCMMEVPRSRWVTHPAPGRRQTHPANSRHLESSSELPSISAKTRRLNWQSWRADHQSLDRSIEADLKGSDVISIMSFFCFSGCMPLFYPILIDPTGSRSRATLGTL